MPGTNSTARRSAHASWRGRRERRCARRRGREPISWSVPGSSRPCREERRWSCGTVYSQTNLGSSFHTVRLRAVTHQTHLGKQYWEASSTPKIGYKVPPLFSQISQPETASKGGAMAVRLLLRAGGRKSKPKGFDTVGLIEIRGDRYVVDTHPLLDLYDHEGGSDAGGARTLPVAARAVSTAGWLQRWRPLPDDPSSHFLDRLSRPASDSMVLTRPPTSPS